MIGTLNTTAMDTPTTLDTARFYQLLLGGTLSTEEDAEWIDLREPSGRIVLSFQRATNHVAPTWPDDTVPLQVHIDIRVDSFDEAEPLVLEAGGRLLEGSEEHPGWRVYADPIGRPFCLVTEV